MEEIWSASKEQTTGILVPTQSLASSLRQSIADQYVAQGKEVWESPNILTWSELLRKYWRNNRARLDEVELFLDDHQSQLIWERVVQRSRRKNEHLTLLNVPQTVRTVQKSWRSVSDWQLNIEEFATSQDADSKQFYQWCHDYQKELNSHQAVDLPMLYDKLVSLAEGEGINRINSPITKLIWYRFDLVNGAQLRWQEAWAACGVPQVQIESPSREISSLSVTQYQYRQTELADAFKTARQYLQDRPDASVRIVIPDLKQILSQAEIIAAEEFYPSVSPRELQNSDLIYRFTLGKSLIDWPAITAAVKLVSVLQGKLAVNELRSLFRAPFFGVCTKFRASLLIIDAELQSQRRSHIDLDQLIELAKQTQAEQSNLNRFLIKVRNFCLEFQAELEASTHQRYRALSFARWRSVIQEWLEIWGWGTNASGSSQSSTEYQLQKSWEQVLAKLEGLALVQEGIGLSRIIELLKQYARDQVFLPEAANSPIVVSGVLEALGHTSDLCIVTGMDESYPPAVPSVPFVGELLQTSSLYPSATPQRHVVQATTVMQRLLGGSGDVKASFSAVSDLAQGVQKSVSPLFRKQKLLLQGPTSALPVFDSDQNLELFDDQQAPALNTQLPYYASGGTRVFADQSQCAFKAFAIHRLGCETEEDTDFGLDYLDRGIVVHQLLENCWRALDNSDVLKRYLQEEKLKPFVSQIVRDTIASYQRSFSSDKFSLLEFEFQRLQTLLLEWLEFEATRPEAFAVIDLEEGGTYEVGNIRFNYKIDRVDMLSDGRTVIMDYKTGSVSRNDWQGERIREPQLPLYWLAKGAQKNHPPAGITYAQVQQQNHKFEELSEAGILRTLTKTTIDREALWQIASVDWPLQMQQLGDEFLTGNAAVNPIDEKVCQYCNLQPLCRIYDQTHVHGFGEGKENE